MGAFLKMLQRSSNEFLIVINENAHKISTASYTITTGNKSPIIARIVSAVQEYFRQQTENKCLLYSEISQSTTLASNLILAHRLRMEPAYEISRRSQI
jgi:hypothetical protein